MNQSNKKALIVVPQVLKNNGFRTVNSIYLMEWEIIATVKHYGTVKVVY